MTQSNTAHHNTYLNTDVQWEWVIKLSRVAFHSEALFKYSSQPENSLPAEENYTAGHISSWLSDMALP